LHMSGYTKLFSDIVDSSIWREPPTICKVWVTLLALSDQDGYIRGSVGWLADKAKVDRANCQQALDLFTGPDPASRTTDNDGRRIEILDDGFLILNYLEFRDRLSNSPKAIATRERVRKHREQFAQRTGRNMRTAPRDRSEGYVYYIHYPAIGKVKIGYSRNPWARLSELRGRDSGLELLAVEPGGVDLERQRHDEFSALRQEGEIFTYSDPLVAFVVALRSRTTDAVGVTSHGPASASVSASDPSVSEGESEGKEPEARSQKPEAKGGLKGGYKGQEVPESLGKDAIFAETWAEWVSIRRAMKAPKDWHKMFVKQLEWLERFGPDIATEIINQTIRNGWQGLFELKEGAGKTGGGLKSIPPLTSSECANMTEAEQAEYYRTGKK